VSGDDQDEQGTIIAHLDQSRLASSKFWQPNAIELELVVDVQAMATGE